MDTSTTYSFTLLHLFCIAVVASLSVEFPVTYRSPSTYYLLPTTYYLLPTTYYLLPTTSDSPFYLFQHLLVYLLDNLQVLISKRSPPPQAPITTTIPSQVNILFFRSRPPSVFIKTSRKILYKRPCPYK